MDCFVARAPRNDVERTKKQPPALLPTAARSEPSTSLRAQRSNPPLGEQKEWIASSQGLLAMTLRERKQPPALLPTAARSNPSTSLRAQRSNPSLGEQKE